MATRTRYLARDPRWIVARYPGVCAVGAGSSQGCTNEILPGDRVYYYPSTKSVYCSSCSPSIAGRAEAELADDDTFGSW